jgi:hypothetical protein
MKICTVSYEEALKRHPVEVASIVKRLRKGKSKLRENDPASFTWEYSRCVVIPNGRTLAEIFTEQNRRRAMTLEDLDAAVADEIKRSQCALYLRAPRVGIGEGVEAPPELEPQVREGFERQAREQARVDAMTPEQRQAEIESLLGQLGRDPGFMVFGE